MPNNNNNNMWGPRMSDQVIREKLVALIEAEADPKERARLMIMLQISSILIDNVRAVQGLSNEMHTHRTEFAKHIKRELELINQGKGMWRVLALALSLAQVGIGYTFWTYVDDVKQIEVAVQRIDKRIEVVEDRFQR